jgi:hypothetical protein
MAIDALVASGFETTDGLAYDVKAKINELVAAANAAGLFDQADAIADIKPTSNMTAITAHTAATAIAATYDDLAAARTSVNTLRTDVEAALDEHDDGLTTLRAEAEARLDAIETKLDAILAALASSGVIAAA